MREWIEMTRSDRRWLTTEGLPLYEGVDWNYTVCETFLNGCCLPLYEGVDWNTEVAEMMEGMQGLPLYEGVDWNGNGKNALKPMEDGLPLYEGVDGHITLNKKKLNI